MNKNKIKILTVLFTEECPLRCRYCFLERDSTYGKYEKYKIEEIKNSVSNFITELKENENGMIVFTGGEPLLYWNEIKTIISENGNQIAYEFNTSGYLLTIEMLEFLSHYQVSFNLSVDGGEKFSNWRRPLKSDSGGVGYYKKTKEIFPYLLYYFPMTKYKVIVTKRCIDLMREQYLEAESLGFRNIEFVIDLNEKNTNGNLKRTTLTPTGTVWEEKDYKAFYQQIMAIAVEISMGLANGIERAHIVGIDNFLKGMLNKSSNIPQCRILDGRTTKGLSREQTSCLKCVGIENEFQASEQFFIELKENGNKCPRNKECKYYNICLSTSCLQDNMVTSGKLTVPAIDFCKFALAYGDAAIKILNFGNQFVEEEFYSMWLNKYIGGDYYASKNSGEF